MSGYLMALQQTVIPRPLETSNSMFQTDTSGPFLPLLEFVADALLLPQN